MTLTGKGARIQHGDAPKFDAGDGGDATTPESDAVTVGSAVQPGMGMHDSVRPKRNNLDPGKTRQGIAASYNSVVVVLAILLLGLFVGCVPEGEVQNRVNVAVQSAVANARRESEQDMKAAISRLEADANRRALEAQAAGLAQGELRARQQLEAKFESSVEQRVAPFKSEVTSLQGQIAELKREMVRQVASAKETGTAVGKHAGYADGLKDARTVADARMTRREKELAEIKDAVVARTQVEARVQGAQEARLSRFWSENAFTLAVASLMGCAVLLGVFLLLNRNSHQDTWTFAEVEAAREQSRLVCERYEQLARTVVHLLPPATSMGGDDNAQ